MRDLWTGEAMRRADARASEEFGIPSMLLMENAGRGAADVIMRDFADARDTVIFCGPGNNGGDGFVVARHLANAGWRIDVIRTRDEYTGDAATALEACISCPRVSMHRSDKISDDDIRAAIERADVAVDALLGTGANGAPRGEVLRLIEILNDSRAHVVSLDIPSGICTDTGEAASSAVRAQMTISFLARKVGTSIAPGSTHAGRVVAVGIGAPRESITDAPAAIEYSEDDITSMKPTLAPDIHKGDRGGLLIVGGSAHYRGAPILAARAALRTGCGYVFLAVPDFMEEQAAVSLPEAVIIPMKSARGHIHGTVSGHFFTQWKEKIDAAIVGPGLGRSSYIEIHVRRALHDLAMTRRPLVIDADALHYLADVSIIKPDKQLVITPHAGEAAYLLGTTPQDVSAQRLASSGALAQRYGTALLKGPHTIINDGTTPRVISAGDRSLAVPGSGDVLSGIIGALLAMGMPAIEAATLGALLHAQAATRAVHKGPLLASDIADSIDGVR